MWVELGTDSYLGKPRRKKFLAGFLGVSMGMVIFSGSVLPLPLCISGIFSEFLTLLTLDRSSWPRCLLWHGWLPALSPRRVQPPWAVAEEDCVDAAVETALGAYPVQPGDAWGPGWDPEDISDSGDSVPSYPNIWTDGSRDEDLDAMIGVVGAGAFVKEVPWVFDGRAWGHAQDLDLDNDASRIFSMVPGTLQTVQRAEYWGVILVSAGFYANPHWD